ncbi:hypothetical protein AC1031_005563 [Aphanomyces cochlioides]|nr:hypothetical protein AC1031_005563 [Aphanomyces cochlioides]
MAARRRRQDGPVMKAGSLLQYFSVKPPTASKKEEIEMEEAAQIPDAPTAPSKTQEKPATPVAPSQDDDKTEHNDAAPLPAQAPESEALASKPRSIGNSPQEVKKKRKLDPSLSEYEQRRLAKMQQNAAFLASLGIEKVPPDKPKPLSKKHTKRPAPKAVAAIPSAPLRRSTRHSSQAGAAESLATATEEPTSSPRVSADKKLAKEAPVPDSTALFQYMCQIEPNSVSSPSKSRSKSQEVPWNYNFITSEELDRGDSQLKKVYSMDSNSSLLVAVGHNGYMSIYSIDPTYSSSPLASFRAHEGWCSGVSLQLSSTKTLVVTAANDALVKLWDVDAANSALNLVTTASTVHSHGIFSLDVSQGNRLATGSKDHSVALSEATPSSIRLLHRYNHHDGVVKCVRFASHDASTILASCGNDGAIVLQDTRKGTTAVRLEGHSRAVNSIRWFPNSSHALISAGFDGHIHVWDTRKPGTPLMSYATAETKKMFSIEFLPQTPSHFVAGVDRALVVYDTTTQRPCSRGELGYDAETVLPLPSGGLVVAHRQTLSWFERT